MASFDQVEIPGSLRGFVPEPSFPETYTGPLTEAQRIRIRDLAYHLVDFETGQSYSVDVEPVTPATHTAQEDQLPHGFSQAA